MDAFLSTLESLRLNEYEVDIPSLGDPETLFNVKVDPVL